VKITDPKTLQRYPITNDFSTDFVKLRITMKRAGDALESKHVKKKKKGRNKVKFNYQDADSLCRVAEGGCRIVSEGGWEGCRATYGLKEGRGFYEVTVVRGLVRVGFATEDGKLEIGTGAKSWGFGGTGKKSWKRKFENYGESFKEGDTIGCYLDFEEKTISFSKNGEWLDVAYYIPKKLIANGEALFPAITIQCGEARANFGASNWAHAPELGFPGFAKASDLVAHPLREEEKSYTHIGDITDMKIDLQSEEAKKRAARRRARFAKPGSSMSSIAIAEKKPDLSMSLDSLTEKKPNLSMSLDSLTEKKPDLSMSLGSLTKPKKTSASKPDLSMSLDSIMSGKPKKSVGKKPPKAKAKPAKKTPAFKSVVQEKEFAVGDPVECRFTQRFRPARVLEVHRKCDMVTHYTVEYLKSKAVFKESSTRVRSKQGNWNFEIPKVEKVQWKDREKVTVKGQSDVLEKKYVRSDANPEAQNVRSVDACKKAFTHLKDLWNKEHNYDFIRDQFKSLRQDLKVQHVVDELTVQVYETNARICLEVRDFSEFNQCQTNLNVLYRQVPEFNQNKDEFLSYRLLYLLAIENFSEMKLSLGRCIGSESELVRSCVNVCVSLRSGNHMQFFNRFNQLSPLAKAILHDCKTDFRFLSLQKMIKGYGPSKVAVSMVKFSLGFNNDENELADAYLLQAGCKITNGEVICRECKLRKPSSEQISSVGGVVHSLI